MFECIYAYTHACQIKACSYSRTFECMYYVYTFAHTLSTVSVRHLLYVHICMFTRVMKMYVRTNAIFALTQILLFRMRVFVWPKSLSLWASCKHTHTHTQTHAHTRHTTHTAAYVIHRNYSVCVCVCACVCSRAFWLLPLPFSISLSLSIYLSLSISLSLCTTGQRLVWEYFSFSFSLSQNLLDHSFGITTLAEKLCVYVYVYVYMYVHVYVYVYVYV